MHKPGHTDFTRHFEQNESARDVGLNYRGWLIDTPVDVGLCSEMYDSITTTHCCFYVGCVADVTLHKVIIGIVRYRFKICEISSVSEFVIVDDRNVFPGGEGISNKVGANKSCTARDKNLHRAAS